MLFVTFGEAMLRLSPVNDGPAMYGRGNPSARAAFMRAVGGDELNVSVSPCLARVLPSCRPLLLYYTRFHVINVILFPSF